MIIKHLLKLFFIITLTSCSSIENEPEIDIKKCNINNDKVAQICLSRNYIAQKSKKNLNNLFLSTIFTGGHPSSPQSSELLIYNFEDTALNMNNKFFDFNDQKKPTLIYEGNNIFVSNGIILNTPIILGDGSYYAPNFQENTQINNENYGYDDYTYNYAKKNQNITFKNMKILSSVVNVNNWNSEILESKLITDKFLTINGSKTKLLNNEIISNLQWKAENSIFPLIQIKKSNLIGYSQQIFPDQSDERSAIPNSLYIKYSPETVINGNTFTLAQKNDQAYAIILDHSPRVRITNNTFNGFKVPILMDQWSSIVDEKGNEIKPENFTGYGNVINSDKFAGNVTMNRKGEIVKQ